jgi:hypothetical protein
MESLIPNIETITDIEETIIEDLAAKQQHEVGAHAVVISTTIYPRGTPNRSATLKLNPSVHLHPIPNQSRIYEQGSANP